ncbi:hypothetical protein B0O80DRAFT_513943 [Mortierella sp. GBAus27b]|nr:hypothetical protein BGX31_008045 [Mortierella sp. GBA43]KAI8349141.1 hypothetical protein B0O80DRAFT_513943 [Mortierella sp. GBAus27b]
MGGFSYLWVLAKTNAPRMPSLWIVIAFILALMPTVQASAFDKSFGVGKNTFTTLSKMTSLIQNNYVPDKAVISFKLGPISGGENSSTGIVPGVTASDSKGSKVFAWGTSNDTCKQGFERIEANGTKLFQEPLTSTAGIASIKMTARDGCAPKGEPVCVSSVVVLPSNGNNKSDPIYLSGNLLTECDAPWYWGADTFQGFNDNCDRQTIREKCVWMSQVPQENNMVRDVQISDVPAFFQGNEGSFRPSCNSNLRMNLLKGTKTKPGTANETNPTFDYVFHNNDDSAKVLCDSWSSYGPSFLSSKESLFCDMPTKQIFPVCNSNLTKGCVKSDGSLLQYIGAPPWTPPSSLVRPMPLKFLGRPDENVNSTTISQTTATLDTIKDPSCRPIQRDKLSVGEKLWAGERLVSNDRNTRLVLDVGGDISTQQGNSTTTLSVQGLQFSDVERPFTYHLELLDDGRICSTAWNTTDQHCIGQAFPKDKYTLELYNNGFLYVKKPSGEVVQIDKCQVLTSLKAGETMTDACLMSSDQSMIVKLTLNRHLGYLRTKREFVKYFGAAMPVPLAPGGPGLAAALELQRDGMLKINIPEYNRTHVLFEGGLGDDEYIVHITNNGTLVLNGSDGQKRWEADVPSIFMA